jgi:rubrerythrin
VVGEAANHPASPASIKTMSITTLEKTARDFFDDVRELFCGECGYGIVVRREPPECPMCRSNEWRAQPSLSRWN